MNMKKAIAILLVVLVAGVMFGATDTLTIKSTVTARTKHGFYAAQISPLNFGKIYSATTTLGDNAYTNIDLYSTVDQPVGFYGFATTASTATVNLTVNPMTATIGNDTYYVPYTLKYVKVAGTLTPAGTEGTGSIALTGSVGTSTVASIENSSLISSTTASGPKWLSLGLNVTVDGEANETYGLPAANYTGTVVATVEAP